jgi:signal transduction histidine kinase
VDEADDGRRDDRARTNRSGFDGAAGLGVVLLECDLVELHGGSATAASAGCGQGSEFIVRLPQND